MVSIGYPEGVRILSGCYPKNVWIASGQCPDVKLMSGCSCRCYSMVLRGCLFVWKVYWWSARCFEAAFIVCGRWVESVRYRYMIIEAFWIILIVWPKVWWMNGEPMCSRCLESFYCGFKVLYTVSGQCVSPWTVSQICLYVLRGCLDRV